MECLMDTKTKDIGLVFAFQLTELNTVEELYCSSKICRQQFANETLAEMQSIIKNHNNKHNPLPGWEKAAWTYFSKPEDIDTARCYLIPMMDAGDTDLVFANNKCYLWKKMLEETKWLIHTTPKSTIQASLLGHNVKMFLDAFATLDLTLPLKLDSKKLKIQELGPSSSVKMFSLVSLNEENP